MQTEIRKDSAAGLEVFSTRFARAASAAAILIGSAGLMGRLFQIALLQGIHPALPPIMPGASLALALAGLALRLDAKVDGSPSHPRPKEIVATVCLLAVVALASLTLAEYFLNLRSTVSLEASPTAALCLLLIGVALMLLRIERSVPTAQVLGLMASFAGMLAVTGYVFVISGLYTARGYAPMSPQMAVMSVVLGLAVLAARPDRVLMTVLGSTNPGGRVARRLLPIGIGFPFLLVLFARVLRLAGLNLSISLTPSLGTVIFLLVAALMCTAPIVWTVVLFYRTDNEALRASEARARQLFESNPLPIWVYDAATLAFLDVNQAAIDRYGYSRDQFLGMTIKDIHPAEDLGSLFEKLSGNSKEFLLARHKKKDGTIIDVEIRSQGMSFAGRDARLVLADDVTENKKLEAQLLRAQRMESIGTLAGGIAHDLNNVLAPILMGLELLKERTEDKGNRDLIEMMQVSTQRGAGVVRQVLTFARGTKGERANVVLKYLINVMQKMFRETFPKGIRIEVQVSDDLWMVVGDATQLDQVLLNLCVNARDAMPQGGTLKITAENLILDEHYARLNIEAKAGPYVVMEITDTGEGIPPEIIEKIFEPFFTTKEIGHGTGLGLSTIRSIVKSHGGFVNVYSEPGRGTRFKVYLPANESQKTREAEARQKDLPLGCGQLVLVVDDEGAVRDITRATLESYNYRILTAADGKEALACYSRQAKEIKAVLLDMMMPVLDGMATIRVLETINPDVRVIAASGLVDQARHGDASSRIRAVRAVLAKPYTAERLLTTLHEVIGQE